MVKKITVQPVVLCGGSGTRLWPLSRSEWPKPFLSLSGDRSLFQKVIERFDLFDHSSVIMKGPIVVCNDSHRFHALEQLKEMGCTDFRLIVEPEGRNTAPALLLASLESSVGEDPVLLALPADQHFDSNEEFRLAIESAIQSAMDGSLVILGVLARWPDTGYGYVRCKGMPGSHEEYAVEHFLEKPDFNEAKKYVDSGNYFWNSGILITKASAWIKAINRCRPILAERTFQSWRAKRIENRFLRPDTDIFLTVAGESIDYAVLENCHRLDMSLKLVPINCEWSDLGTWDRVWAVDDRDPDGNASSGDVVLRGCSNVYSNASSRLVVGVGLNNLVIIETADAVLVADMSSAKSVAEAVQALSRLGRPEVRGHRKTKRPWGYFEILAEGPNFKVKRIMVNPKSSLSLQMHHHRDEHWIVVSGVGEATIDSQVSVLTPNQSVIVNKGVVHRLANRSEAPLEIIEIQYGTYTGEDDIVRFNDEYARV